MLQIISKLFNKDLLCELKKTSENQNLFYHPSLFRLCFIRLSESQRLPDYGVL